MTTSGAIGQTADPPRPEIGFERAVAIGSRLAANFRAQVRRLDSDPVQQYVAELGARLAAQLPNEAPPYDYRFEVIEGAGGGSALEPAALPGGYIFVPAELLLAAGDEAELAGMLAHALAHLAARHGLTDGGVRLSNVASIPLIFMGSWTGYGLRTTSGSATPVGLLTVQRSREFEADAGAVSILARAGFDAAALPRYLDRRQQDASDRPLPRVFSPHPPHAERMARLEAAIAELPEADSPPGLNPTTAPLTQIHEAVREAYEASSAARERDEPPTLRRPGEPAPPRP